MSALTEPENERIFHRSIIPRVFGSLPVPPAGPVAEVIRAEPGAGKSTIAQQLHEQLPGAAVLDVDAFRVDHPDHVRMSELDDSTAWLATGADANSWFDKALDYAVQQGFDVIREGGTFSADSVERDARMFGANQYGVRMNLVAVPEPVSRLRVLQRFHEGREEEGFGRYVDRATQVRGFSGALLVADRVRDVGCVDILRIYNQNGEQIHTNERGEDGEWLAPYKAREVIDAERSRPFTPGETAQFIEVHEKLGASLGKEWQRELADIAASAAALLPDSVAPGKDPRRASHWEVAFPGGVTESLRRNSRARHGPGITAAPPGAGMSRPSAKDPIGR